MKGNYNKITIGFSAGAVVYGVGSSEYFLLFFQKIKELDFETAKKNRRFQKLICDRLYRRYVKMEDLKETTAIMSFIAQQFNCINGKNGSLYLSFKELFKGYSACQEALDCWEGNKLLGQLRIIVTSLPYASFDRRRPLEELDSWDGPPFWTRFYLKELYDQGKEIPELPF